MNSLVSFVNKIVRMYRVDEAEFLELSVINTVIYPE